MRRVVITGLGAVSPCGLDVPTTWRSIQAGKSGIATIRLFDPAEYVSKIAGECKEFDPEKYIPRREVRTMDRFIHLSLAASDELMRDTGLSPDDPIKLRTGTLIGVGIGGLTYIDNTFQYLDLNDWTSGLIKAAVFGLLIAVIGCAKGFHTTGGAEGVGRATTQAVVMASMAILISDFFLTKILF